LNAGMFTRIFPRNWGFSRILTTNSSLKNLFRHTEDLSEG
jgi:hypothetical protein